MIQAVNSTYLATVDVDSDREYATRIEKAEDSKDKTENSIFEVQQAAYSASNKSTSKKGDSKIDLASTDKVDNSSVLSTLKSLYDSLTSLIQNLTNAKNKSKESDDEDSSKDEQSGLTTSSKVNNDKETAQQKESNNGVTRVTDENLMQLLADDGFDTTSLKSSDMADILGYNSEYKDGTIVCKDGKGNVVKYYTFTDGGCKCFNRYDDKFCSTGFQSHTIALGDGIKTPPSWFVNDDVVYYGLYDVDGLKDEGFDVLG